MALKASVLIVAGTDPTGGAGIVRDIETTAYFGIKANLAITSVNVQDDKSVSSIHPQSGKLVREQMLAALNTGQVKAIKIGMTGSEDIIAAIDKTLDIFSSIPVVFDPVLAASSGGGLAKENLISAILSKLINKIELITPNLAELALLTETPVAKTNENAIKQAQLLVSRGARYVLVKGGHIEDEMAIDSLVSKDHIKSFTTPRVSGTMRGTGCTLSTALATQLAKGKTLEDAIPVAKAYVTELIKQTNNVS